MKTFCESFALLVLICCNLDLVNASSKKSFDNVIVILQNLLFIICSLHSGSNRSRWRVQTVDRVPVCSRRISKIQKNADTLPSIQIRLLSSHQTYDDFNNHSKNNNHCQSNNHSSCHKSWWDLWVNDMDCIIVCHAPKIIQSFQMKWM